MPDEDLQQLVRRRLFELGMTPQDASRMGGWAVAPQTIERMAAGKRSALISERLAGALAASLCVPENRVRRVVGLPLVDDARTSIVTGRHFRLIPGGR